MADQWPGRDHVQLALAVLEDLVDDCTDQASAAIHQSLPSYSAGEMTEAGLRTCIGAVFRQMIDQLRRHGEVDRMVFRDFATAQAEADIPLAEVQSALWIAFQIDWNLLLPALRRLGASPQDQDTAGRILWDLGHRMNLEVVETYRHEVAARVEDRTRRNSARIQALLHDTLTDPGSRFDALSSLGLAPAREICVVVSRVHDSGTSPLPGIQSRLKSVPLASAWHLDVTHVVGLVSASTSYELEMLRKVTASYAPARVGVSVPVQPSELSRGWRLAWLALGSTSTREPVSVFGDDPTGNLIAATSPEQLHDFSRRTLAGLDELPEPAREQLIETFVAWLECDGSTAQSARLVFRHPNTVRYRLRKLEKLSGRSLRHPKDVSELALAVRVAHHASDRLPRSQHG